MTEQTVDKLSDLLQSLASLSQGPADFEEWSDCQDVEKKPSKGKPDFGTHSFLRVHQIYKTAPIFKNRQVLSRYKINGDMTYSKGGEPALLRLPDVRKNLKVNLRTGFEESLMISDYISYRAQKWNYFLRTLREDGLLADDPKTRIVAFSGVINTMLSSPYSRDWVISASKFKNNIYLMSKRSPPYNVIVGNNRPPGEVIEKKFQEGGEGAAAAEVGGQVVNATAAAAVNVPKKDLMAYYGVKLQQLVTDSKDKDKVINEFEKQFMVFKATLGDHQLLLCSEIDAIDEKGNWVEVKPSPVKRTKEDHRLYQQRRLLNWWSQCVVSGIKYAVVGERDEQGILSEMKELTTEDMAIDGSLHWTPATCYGSLDSLLDFIKQKVQVDDPSVVYKFEYKRNARRVTFKKMPTGSAKIIPDSLLEAFN